jgi:hypothetical protein
LRSFAAALVLAALLVPATGLVPAQAEQKAPEWFAWGMAWFSDRTEDSHTQGDSTWTSDESSTFLVKRCRFGVNGQAGEKWFYHFCAATELTPKLMQAWLEYRYCPALRAKVGQFKHGFGREGYAPCPQWKFTNLSYVVDKLGSSHIDGGSSLRDQGLMVYGTLKPSGLAIDYSAAMLNGSGINKADTDGKKDFAGHLGVELPAGVRAGGTFYTGEDGTTELGRSGFGVDAGFAKDKIWVLGEYLVGTLEQADGADDLKKAGYHVGATYRVMKMVEVGARYDAYDPNTDSDDDGISRITIGAGYYFAGLNRASLNVELPSAESEDIDPGTTMILQLQGFLK